MTKTTNKESKAKKMVEDEKQPPKKKVGRPKKKQSADTAELSPEVAMSTKDLKKISRSSPKEEAERRPLNRRNSQSSRRRILRRLFLMSRNFRTCWKLPLRNVTLPDK